MSPRNDAAPNKLPRETDWDRLNKLIDWYEAFKPHAGRTIQVKFSEDYLVKKLGEPNAEGLWPYRERLLQRVTE